MRLANVQTQITTRLHLKFKKMETLGSTRKFIYKTLQIADFLTLFKNQIGLHFVFTFV